MTRFVLLRRHQRVSPHALTFLRRGGNFPLFLKHFPATTPEGRPAARARLGLPERPTALFVGSLSRGKGPGVAVGPIGHVDRGTLGQIVADASRGGWASALAEAALSMPVRACEASDGAEVLWAQLQSSFALCLYDEVQEGGALLHMQIGRPGHVADPELTDNTLSTNLLLLDSCIAELRHSDPRARHWQVPT